MLKKLNRMISGKQSAAWTQESSLQTYAASLNQRAAELDAREQAVAAQEAALNSRSSQVLRDLKEYKAGLLNLERRILDYAKQYDQKDAAILQELTADAQKVKKFRQKYSLDNIKNGYEFEEVVAHLLEQNGFVDVQVTPKSKDFGADILAQKDSVQYVIQCKFYSSPVGIDAVQQVYGAKVHYGAHVPVVITNQVFTKAAKILAEETRVLLWDCEVLQRLMKTAS